MLKKGNILGVDAQKRMWSLAVCAIPHIKKEGLSINLKELDFAACGL